jgi:Flp pilus assembly protein CpaB
MSAQALPRAVARTRRIDIRVVLGLLLFALGVLASSRLISQAQERTPVLVAARGLQPGHTIEAGDLRVAEIGLSPGVASLSASELDALVGRVLTAPVQEGQVMTPGTIASGPSLAAGEVAISVGVAPQHAAGGSLRSGDRVALLATEDPNRPTARTSVLLSDIEVIAVQEEQGSAVDPLQTVTLAVAYDDAAAVAQAANSGVLDLALLPKQDSQ